jgi:uncharacterized phage protein (TIGR02218 family)
MAIGVSMKTHLAGSATYLAHLLRVEERPREIPITWAAASIANVVARGGYLRKNGGTNGSEDAAARSIVKFNGDVYARMTTRLDGTVYFGFTTTANNTAAASSINFAIRVDSAGEVRVYEAGVLKYTHGTAAKSGDHLRVQRDTFTISYWLNRTKIYTSATMTSSAFYCDVSIVTTDATINEAVFGKPPAVIRVTDHTRKITFNSEEYSPLPLLPTRLVKSTGLRPDNAELTHVLRAGGVIEADILGGRWDYARFEYMAVNYLDLTMGVAQRMVGRFGEFKIDNGRFTAEMRSLSQPLSQEIGDITGSLCVARQLGDFRCGQPMDDYTHESTIATVVDALTIEASVSPTPADGYFEYGLIYFRNGENQLYEREIKNNTGNTLTLQRPFPFLPDVGDAVVVVAGCNRLFSKCKTFVNANNPSGTNAENFQGFHLMPGFSKLLKYPE